MKHSHTPTTRLPLTPGWRSATSALLYSLLPLTFLILACPAGQAPTDSLDHSLDHGQDEVSNLCPASHPRILNPDLLPPWPCDLPVGTVCTWPAEACGTDQKPENTCTCVVEGGAKHFDCTRPFHNCLPLQDGSTPGHLLTRPLPIHRETPQGCQSTVTPRNEACSPSRAGMADETCNTDADCEDPEARCLDSYVPGAGGGTACQCFVPECLADSECPDDNVCLCGATANDLRTPCGGFFGTPCLHKCIPAECKTDSDCGQGGLCSPSEDQCGWQVEYYACHHQEAAECFSDWECMGWLCRFQQETGWSCEQPPVCD